MKILLLLLFLFPKFTQASLAPGTVALYFDSTKCSSELIDATGNFSLTEVGIGVPYGNQGQPVGTLAAGDFDANSSYYTQATLSNTMDDTPNTWSVEGYFKLNSIVAFNTVWTVPAVSYLFGGFNVTDGVIRVDKGGVGNNGTNGFGTGTWKHYAVSYNGSNLVYYINGVEDKNLATSSFPWPTQNAAFQIGSYTGAAFKLGGYACQLRFSNIYKTVFPTVDPSDNTLRSVKITNNVKLKIN